MNYISDNPFEGARRAFFGFDPNATSSDWLEYCGQRQPHEMTDVEGLISLAGICQAGATNKAGLFDEDEVRFFCYCAGYFQALLDERFGDLKKAA